MNYKHIWDTLGYGLRWSKIQATKAKDDRKIMACVKVWNRMATPSYTVIPKMGTLWFRWMKDKDGKEFWDFNHLEDGYCQNDQPTPKHPSHKQVWNGKWKKEIVHLTVRPMQPTKVGHFL